MDSQDGLPLCDEESGEVFGEVAALALVGEEIAVLVQGILNDRGEFDDPWHDDMLRSPTAQTECEEKWSGFIYFNASGDYFAKHQFGIEMPHTEFDQVKAETTLLLDFFWLADFAGLPLPEDSQLLRLQLGVIARKVRSGDRHDIRGWPDPELLSLLAIAQHHSLPTRLLDWSRSPMVAAYFAACEANKRCREFEKKNQEVPTNESLSVWAFDYSAYLERLPGHWTGTAMLHPELSPAVHLVTAPRASNPNLHAQDGVFTLFRPSSVNPTEQPDRRPLNDQVAASIGNDPKKDPLLHEFTLPIEQSDMVMWRLSQIGVNAATLFPGFGGVVRTLEEED